MPKITILASASVAAALLSAVVFAASPTTDTEATVAKTPNRAEVFAASTCGETSVAQAAAWHTALGSKRVLDRSLILVAATSGTASDCAPKAG